MNDTHTDERRAWIQAGAPAAAPVPLIYRRHPDGSPVLNYTPAEKQGPDYLREKFDALRRRERRILTPSEF